MLGGNLAENPPDPSAAVLIPKDVSLKRVCVAITLEKNLLTVAMSHPLLFSLVQAHLAHPVDPVNRVLVSLVAQCP